MTSLRYCIAGVIIVLIFISYLGMIRYNMSIRFDIFILSKVVFLKIN